MFTLQDISASFLAVTLYPLVFVTPGYVCAHTFDLFDFKKRMLAGRLSIAVTMSMAVSPIVFFLCCRFGSFSVAYLVITLLLAGTLFLFWQDRKMLFSSLGVSGKLSLVAVCLLAGWSLFAILSLVDIQLGQRLYYSVVSYDLTSRVSITAAITRSGVPPINPGYYPGKPVSMTFLYYFWYVLASLIDRIGGRWVDARTAMIASTAWCGIGLMALISLYLRLRNPCSGTKAWKNALLGIGALSISGLDIIPVLGWMIRSRITLGRMLPEGDIEHWNAQITAWLGAIQWVPHHVAGLIACMAAFLLIQQSRGKSIQARMAALLVAGLSLASACGLTIYVTIVFALFWMIWALHLLVVQKDYRTVWIMAAAGLFSLIAASPYLSDLLGRGGGTSPAAGSLAAFPIAFQIRLFGPVVMLLPSLSNGLLSLLCFLALPINYFMELGFFFLVGFLWFRKNVKTADSAHPYLVPEILLLGTSFFIGTFFRSTVIASNDLGWRCWMFGQFVLLIWAVDIGQDFVFHNPWKTCFSQEPCRRFAWNSKVMLCLMGIGILTTLFSLFLLRFWPMMIDLGITGTPTALSPDRQFGTRTYAARLAYGFIRDDLPKDIIVQYDPLSFIDRPSGLYLAGFRQMGVADYASFGVPEKAIRALKTKIAPIFQDADTGWPKIDQICRKHSLNVIIVNDLDPVWEELPELNAARPSLYQNAYYAVFACGDFPGRPLQAHNP